MSFLKNLPTPRSVSMKGVGVPMGGGAVAVEERRVVVKGMGGGGAGRYPHRKGFVPRSAEDFGDGGAFPEIHIAQYPLGLGSKDTDQQKTVAVTLDSEGNVKYEAVLGVGEGKLVQARHSDMVEKRFADEELRKPDPEQEAETTRKTREALEKTLLHKSQAAQGLSSANSDGKGPTYMKYTPSQPNAQTRVIRMTEMPVDPLEPPQFKYKKVPRGPPSPPAPVMHSPPRKVTMQDQQDWKIPPCISNWKNNKGYTIPLDKRLAADGRGLEEVVINDNFAKLSESLYIAERVAREEVAKRSEIEKRLKLKEKEKKEEMLRKLAQEARLERAASQTAVSSGTEQDESLRRERDDIREDRRRERERDLRMQRNKSSASRSEDRDVSEKIALGMAAAPTSSSETMYDQRLFNQSQGMDSGFGDEDAYNVYSKPLFSGSSSANSLYRPKKDMDSENYGSEQDFQKLLDTSKFKPDKDFSGVEREHSKSQARDKPVEFEKSEPEEDLFGLSGFFNAAKTGSKPLDKIGKTGNMHAMAGNAMSDASGASKRKSINFEPSSTSSKKHR